MSIIEPAKLGQIPLVTNQEIDSCGAAFSLIAPAKADVSFRFDSSEIEIKKGQRDVVIRFNGSKDVEEVFQQGHMLAQKGLDLASVLGMLDAIIQDAENDHTLWWSEESGLVVRMVSTFTMPMGVGHMTLNVTDADGNVVPPTPVYPRHHMGFRYYRLAQSSDDLYDAFRNMYLAFEALLSERFPKLKKGDADRKNNEGEYAWLKRGLKASQPDIMLDDLTPDKADTVNSILQIIYINARLPLFHAKSGEIVFAPHDSTLDRKNVSEALRILTHIVLRMASKWFDARRMGGMVAFGWVYELYSKMFQDGRMLASNIKPPADSTENDSLPQIGDGTVSLITRLAPELQRGAEPAIFGYISHPEQNSLTSLFSVCLVNETSPLLYINLESELSLEGVDKLEILMHIRAVNSNQPKSLFRQ